MAKDPPRQAAEKNIEQYFTIPLRSMGE